MSPTFDEQQEHEKQQGRNYIETIPSDVDDGELLRVLDDPNCDNGVGFVKKKATYGVDIEEEEVNEDEDEEPEYDDFDESKDYSTEDASALIGRLSTHSTTPNTMMSGPPPHHQQPSSGGGSNRRRSSKFAASARGLVHRQSSGLATMEGNDGIHSFAMYIATASNVSSLKAYCSMLLSWCIVTVQIIVYGFIIGESSKGHCKIDDDCRNGQICGEDWFCRMAPPTTFIDNIDEEEGGGSTRQHHCPFLEDNQPDKWSIRIVMIFIFFYIVGFTIEDMDQSSRIHRAATFRLDNDRTYQQLGTTSVISPIRRRWVAFNIWAIYYIRTYAMPCVAFQASIAIIYAESVTAQGIILNGLAVGFVGSFDDALLGILIPPRLQLKSAMAMQFSNEQYILMNRNNNFEQQELIKWMKDRVMCFSYVVLCCWIIFHPNQAIIKSPPFVLGFLLDNPSYQQDYASCDDFVSAIATWPTVILLLFSALDKVIIGAPKQVMIRDFFLGPLFSILYFAVALYSMMMIYIYL